MTTGWPEAVAHLRLPQNVACGFAALRSSEVASQYGDQCLNIPGNAIVRIVTTEHLIEMIHLILERQVPHPPHLVLQSRERASQSRLFRTHTNPKVAFLIASGALLHIRMTFAFTTPRRFNRRTGESECCSVMERILVASFSLTTLPAAKAG